MKTLHIFTVIFLLTSATATLSAGPEEDSPVNKHTRRTSEHGDAGKFSGTDSDNTNVLVLWPGDPESIVRRIRPATHTGAAPKAFKLWKNAGGSGGFPVNLKSSAGFCSFIRKIESSPGLNGCICDDTPGNTGGRTADCNPPIPLAQCSPPQCNTAGVGEVHGPENETSGQPDTPEPAACASWSTGPWSPSRSSRCSGTRFTQTRSVFKAPPGCTGTLPGSPRSSQTATGTKTTGSCSTNTITPPPITPPPVTPCTATSWDPPASSQCKGISFTQTRTTCPGNRTQTRPASGVKCCGTTTAWMPLASNYHTDEIFTQRRTNACGEVESRSARGTKRRVEPCDTTGWSPSPDNHCKGASFTQTRNTCPGNIRQTRSAIGTKCCGAAADWSPSTSAQCEGTSFTQTRTDACGLTETRTATGTKVCCTIPFRVCPATTHTSTLGDGTEQTYVCTYYWDPMSCRCAQLFCGGSLW